MNLKQASRYIKRRMGDAVKKQILKRDGILLEDKSIQRVAKDKLLFFLHDRQ